MKFETYLTPITIIGTIGLGTLMILVGIFRFQCILHGILLLFTLPILFLGFMLIVMYKKGNSTQLGKQEFLILGIVFIIIGAIPTVLLGSIGQLFTVEGIEECYDCGPYVPWVVIQPYTPPNIFYNLLLVFIYNNIQQQQTQNFTNLILVIILSIAVIITIISFVFYKYSRKSKKTRTIIQF